MEKWIWQLAAFIVLGIILIAASDFLTKSQDSAPQAIEQSNLGDTAKSLQYKKTPYFQSYAGVINDPDGDDFLSYEQLKGKVVLVDIWTYSCINCIRTLPYVQSWNEKYSDNGLVVIGVHSPEFEFEKERSNVEDAVKSYGLTFPIILDNDRKLWSQFKNSYWPRKYLIDADGYIRYDHIGEGGYDETEDKIVELLKELNNSSKKEDKQIGPESVDFAKIGTPELYFGANYRRAPLGNQKDGTEALSGANYTIPDKLTPNLIYISGAWKDNGETMELVSEEGEIALYYSAKAVHLVADSKNSSTLRAYIDDSLHKPVDSDSNSSILVSKSRLYRIAELQNYGSHILRIKISGSGFRAYSFTFG